MLLWAFNVPPKKKPVNFYHKNETIMINPYRVAERVRSFLFTKNKQAGLRINSHSVLLTGGKIMSTLSVSCLSVVDRVTNIK